MGMVTDIQRFSLSDGPGIRTTVFFKGCNVACAWCHNPETLSSQPEILTHPDKCIRCGACVGFDPARAGQLPPERSAVTAEDARACFSGALTLAGREMTAAQVMEEVLQDLPYYQASGGGVTLSGGEVMVQPDFAHELLQACRTQGIATAIETNLLYDFAQLAGLLPLVDLVMADLKLADGALHRQYIGADNRQALENLRRVAAFGVPFIVRTPVVPGVTDTPEIIASIARLVADCGGNLLYYELLNFNPLGAGKYDGLCRPNPFRDARPLSDARLAQLAQAAAAAGIPVRAN